MAPTGQSMKRQSLYFEGPRQVSVRTEEIPALKPGEVLVRGLLSGISPGTEMLIYRDQAPKDMDVDLNIEALGGEFSYPFKYGYSMIGEVTSLGEGVDGEWLGRRVFAFNPHESHFNARVEHLHPLQEGATVDDAVFLPNMETAVNFLMDGKPLIGENIVVFGQGVIGLLTTALLTEFPLAKLVTVDTYAKRREISRSLGADRAIPPQELVSLQQAWQIEGIDGADLIYELSGSPDALNQAIQLAGFESRIIVGSWYGEKMSSLALGREFHRGRIKLVSSQVSTLAAEHRGRWNKARRFALAWEKLIHTRPARIITHRFPIVEAPLAFQLLDENPESAVQVVLQYD
jgi:2-desacetyl-2-hydroxyethyl bacteriochlorophyllide A dehydrogenase